jgi:hypothetical protein
LAALDGWTTLPAPGALIMALITELSAEQREQNRETIWAQTEAVAESMKTEADKMREMAKIQLAMGLVASAVTVAGGLTQGLMTRGGGTGPEAMLTAARAQGAGQAVGGGAGIFSAMGQYFGTMYQAEFKEMEADQEKMRTMRDSIKDFNDGLKELIQKSLASADSIQQSRNQAMTRILA